MVADPGAGLKCGMSLTEKTGRPSLCRVEPSRREHPSSAASAAPLHRLGRCLATGALACLASTARVAAAPLVPPQANTPTAAGSTSAPKGVPIELPDGPTARAFASSPSTGHAPEWAGLGVPGLDVALVSRHAWRTAKTWDVWSRLMLLEAKADTHDVRRQAGLALLALAQERWDDAWLHFDACDTSKEWMTALLPSFLPGVPAGTRWSASVLPPPLPSGIELRPSLPPPSDKAGPGRIDVRAMKIEGFVVGEATLAMRVSVEVEGVQIDIDHRSGGAARLSIVIPEPAEYEIANEYVDWSVQTTHHEPLPLEIKPGDETHTIYGRFQPRPLSHPTRASERVPAQVEHGTVWLLVPDEAVDRAYFDAIAESLKRLPLRLDCRLRTEPLEVAPPRGDDPRSSGVTVDLRSAEERDDKLAWLVSSLERILLAPDRVRPR